MDHVQSTAAVTKRAALALFTLLCASNADAFDVPRVKIDKAPIKVDVTEVSIGTWRFLPRISEGELPADGGWGQWLNRLNVALNWKKWTLGARLDSVVYWDRPNDGCSGAFPTSTCRSNFSDYSSRWRDSIYPAKLWLTYQASGIEITAGDAYVQLGRGLVLSMRKIDDLGIDNTIRGAKIQIQKDPFAVTVVAGLANPSRVDEPSGRALLLPAPADPNNKAQSLVQPRGPQPLFGSDRIVAAEIQAGRGSPLVLSTQLMHLTRCAPYAYNRRVGGVLKDPNAPEGSIPDYGSLNDFGIGSTCDQPDVESWLTVPATGIRRSPEVAIIGQSLELPRLGKFGNLYVGAAMMHRSELDPRAPNPNGNALYASYSGTIGIVTNTFEVKSYRNYVPVFGSVDQRAIEYQNIAYTTPPTTEVITQDAMFGAYNWCVDGGRLRTDVRVNKAVLVWGQGIYAHTKNEQSAECNASGKILATPGQSEASLQDDIVDLTAGLQWDFERNRSFLYAQAGGRADWKSDGTPFYRETQTRYTLSKWLGGPFSIELAGLHRIRWEEVANLRDGGFPQQWVEGENYTALKIAPKWIVSQGFEYKTSIGNPTYYVNGSLTYKFTERSNIKLLAGQQRGGLRCINGVCRIFPAFEGVRAELTLRF